MKFVSYSTEIYSGRFESVRRRKVYSLYAVDIGRSP